MSTPTPEIQWRVMYVNHLVNGRTHVTWVMATTEAAARLKAELETKDGTILSVTPFKRDP